MKNILWLLLLVFQINETSAQWKKVEGYQDLTIAPSLCIENNSIYVGADSAVFISRNSGQSWTKTAKISEDVDFVSAILKHENKLYVGTYNFGVFVSSDEGASWKPLNENLVGLGAETISKLIVYQDYLYAGTMGAGVFRLNLKNPQGWAQFNVGLSFETSYSIYSLVILNGVLYTGAGANGYFYTYDGVSNGWKEMQFGIITGEPLIFYDIIQLGPTILISTSYGLFKSEDGGKNFWQYSFISYFIANSNFSVHGNKTFVHLSDGVGRTFWLSSSDAGKKWNFVEDQLGVVVLNTVVVDDKLYAGRLDGLWSQTLKTTDVKEEIVSTNFKLNQNYPNPFNPVTKIKYSIPSDGFVTLNVYDVLGREVASLINNESKAGVYEVEFNGANLSSGVYFYQLKSGSFSEVKKLILAK
ncbi:MAG: T9SS type A sorting domain-containing protein [Melioribacteraceae bacterium]